MWNPAEKLSMTEGQRMTLKAWVGAKTSPQRTVLRARICLLAAEGLSNRVIAQTLKTSRPTVVQWRKRFEEQGPQGLAEDAPHGLSSRALPAEKLSMTEGQRMTLKAWVGAKTSPREPCCVHAFACWLQKVCLTESLPKL